MKKTLLTIVAALVATSSFGQMQYSVSLKDISNEARTQKSFKTAITGMDSPMRESAKQSRRSISDLSSLAGDVIVASQNYDVDSETNKFVEATPAFSGKPASVSVVDATTLGISFDGTHVIKASVNLEDGTFTIAPEQVMYTSTSYGDVYMRKASGEGDTFTGSINEDGVISIDQVWYEGIVYQETKYRWSDCYFASDIYKANGTMTFTKSATSYTDNVLIVPNNESRTEKKVRVFNFGGYETAIDITLKENSFIIESQLVASSSNGDFYTYNANATDPQITGTGTATTLTFGSNWTCYAPTSGYWYGSHSNTTITLTDGTEFEYPSVAEVAATPANPTISDFCRLVNYSTLTFNIPTVDVNGKDIKASLLKYQVYSDINGTVSALIDAQAYSEETDYIKGTSNAKTMALTSENRETYQRIGVKSIYTAAGETNESEIVWYDIPQVTVTSAPTGAITSNNLAGTEVTSQGDAAYTATIKVVADGNDLYLQGVFEDAPEAWIKGTKAGDGKYVFTAGQELGTYSSYRLFLLGYNKANDTVGNAIISVDTENNKYVFETSFVANAGYLSHLYYLNNVNAGTTIEISGTDGIDMVKALNVENGALFNLAGQRVAESYKGLVIKNGKKYVVK